MKSTRKVILLSLTGLFGVCIFASVTWSFVPVSAYSEKIDVFKKLNLKLVKTDSMPDKIKVRVRDAVLTTRQFERYKAFRQSEAELKSETPPTDEMLLEEWITEELLYQQAMKENVGVSLDEAMKEVQKAKAFLESLPPDSEIRRFHRQVLEAMGVSEEQYWNEIMPSEYRKMMSISRLYDELVKRGQLRPPSGDSNEWAEQIRRYRHQRYQESIGKEVFIY